VEYGLIGLFLNGLFSSIIPIPTELTATALLLAGESKVIVFVVLTVSSVTGGFIAYYIGFGGNTFFRMLHKKPTTKSEQRGYELLTKYGWVAIFFCSWIPILGDVIPIVAGAKRYDFGKFALSMSIGKMIKDFAIVYLLAIFTARFFG
jgi:membrane protein YqaA with SNARE-associated domain